jgi:hypothetical protein
MDDDSFSLILVLFNDSHRHFFVLNMVKRDNGQSAGKNLKQDSCGMFQDTSQVFALRK